MGAHVPELAVDTSTGGFFVSADAPLGDWRICVLGGYDGGGSTI